MAIASKLAFAALTGLFVANFATSASAQAQAVEAVRDAAIHKCVTEAQQRYPNVSDPSNQRDRTDVYISCMRAAGQNP
jgi:hypothetical protein